MRSLLFISFIPKEMLFLQDCTGTRGFACHNQTMVGLVVREYRCWKKGRNRPIDFSEKEERVSKAFVLAKDDEVLRVLK
jgi:hypothetical protein